ncbi:hypothetical protein [Massilia frigida]|nr:hypothetical protein [Massilia frigida]
MGIASDATRLQFRPYPAGSVAGLRADLIDDLLVVVHYTAALS